MSGLVNSQVTDAVNVSASVTIGSAPSFAMAVTYVTMADSIGLVMQNAVIVQKNMQTITNSAVATTCAMIITKGAT